MFLFKQNLNKYNHLQNLKYLSLTDEKKNTSFTNHFIYLELNIFEYYLIFTVCRRIFVKIFLIKL